VGEAFFANEQEELPMRRIVRGVSRVYYGEKEMPAASSADTQSGETATMISLDHETPKLD
jgi:hypothetical protein